MKPTKPTEKSTYTASEIVEILQRAEALGVVSLRLEGFEASWEARTTVITTQPQAPATAPEQSKMEPTDYRKKDMFSGPPKDRQQSQCNRCQSQLTNGNYGLYCHPCYLRRKEKNWQQSQKW